MESIKVNLNRKVENGITDEVENSVVTMLYAMKKEASNASSAFDTPVTLVSISVGKDNSLNITLNIMKSDSRKSIIDYFEQKGYEVIQ